MDKASETIFALKPVTFLYKSEIDAGRTLCFGLIAEDVAQVSPDLITRDAQGHPQTVRYEAVNAMLLNEFLKEHRMVEAQSREIQEQKTMITELKQKIETVAQHLKDHDLNIQKVIARIETDKLGPKVVVNRP